MMMTQECRFKFNEWIRKVRRTEKTINYLEQKRKYYESRWLSIGGPSYDRTGGHSNDPYYVKGMYEFSHMLEIEDEIKKLVPIIKEYNAFYDSVERKYKLILDSIMFGKITMVKVSHLLHISRTMVYKLKEQLIELWIEKAGNIGISS